MYACAVSNFDAFDFFTHCSDNLTKNVFITLLECTRSMHFKLLEFLLLKRKQDCFVFVSGSQKMKKKINGK